MTWWRLVRLVKNFCMIGYFSWHQPENDSLTGPVTRQKGKPCGTRFSQPLAIPVAQQTVPKHRRQYNTQTRNVGQCPT